MTRFVILSLACLLGWGSTPFESVAQPMPSLSSQRAPVEVGIDPVAQTIRHDGNTLTAFSSRAWLAIPIGDATRFWMQAMAGSVDGSGVPQLAGLADAQAGLSHVRSVGSTSLNLTVGANLPSGQTELASDELETAILMSQSFYGLQMSSAGQGWSVSPGATLVVPLSDAVAIGVGATYRYFAAYAPIDAQDDYTPGNEVLLAAGLDLKITPTSAWSLDASYTVYGADEQGDVKSFEAGNRVALTTQYLMATRYQQLRVLARYEGRARSTVQPLTTGSPLDASPLPQELRTVPQRGAAMVHYSTRLRPRVQIALRGEGYLYGRTDRRAVGEWTLDDSQALFRGAVSLPLSLTPTLTWSPRVAVTAGSFTGLEGGASLRWRR